MGRKKWKNYQDSLTQSNATDLLIKPSIGKFQLIVNYTLSYNVNGHGYTTNINC